MATTSRLAKADAQIKALVKPCRSAYCFGQFRVKGLEYATGGCMDYDQALAVAKQMDAVGGPDEWRRLYGGRFA